MLPAVRDVLGFNDVALLCSLAIGGLLSWIGPLTYVGICQCAAIANYSGPLTGASRPPADRSGWIAGWYSWSGWPRSRFGVPAPAPPASK
jgi:hypothetical protein